MKKIINGKKYDTSTAKKAGEWDNGCYGDFNYCSETLYLKKTGEFFLHGEGGARSPYSSSMGNCYGSGEQIIPLEKEDAMKWAEQHISADDYEAIFGEVAE